MLLNKEQIKEIIPHREPFLLVDQVEPGDHLADQADVFVKIPMAGKAESLNAAVAAAVLVYEAARQRNFA